MKRFFTFDPTGEGFECHNTANEARDHCQRIVNLVISDDYDEDDVAFICWGEIKGQVTLKDKRKPTEEEEVAFGWSFVADVVLEDLV